MAPGIDDIHDKPNNMEERIIGERIDDQFSVIDTPVDDNAIKLLPDNGNRTVLELLGHDGIELRTSHVHDTLYYILGCLAHHRDMDLHHSLH